ncbi:MULTISPECIES: hypothetical protein [Enterococcus]|uniref:Uncharacterized protein n=1 Tax=Enterococcus casseliflavus TaxID=37734 RepID=A0ABD5FR08_ENTCA|nr:hypothetical protein [Enterococcus casseliflavus]MDU3349735.1 hypothetical protein [Clostridium sp.]DAI72460.1 MAG TPA: hypothetical protein [Caudoviricetes sp.]EOH79778.1 hypothetical protein UAM_02511 [Enterococcus casseliflavus ATCC 49996]EOU09215.1 hypothetical protein I582_02380 [Enterococcus casseliflavus ATCC 49996]MCD5191582.1 hypothetical protein [Enterococcus casseliflavus]
MVISSISFIYDNAGNVSGYSVSVSSKKKGMSFQSEVTLAKEDLDLSFVNEAVKTKMLQMIEQEQPE